MPVHLRFYSSSLFSTNSVMRRVEHRIIHLGKSIRIYLVCLLFTWSLMQIYNDSEAPFKDSALFSIMKVALLITVDGAMFKHLEMLFGRLMTTVVPFKTECKHLLSLNHQVWVFWATSSPRLPRDSCSLISDSVIIKPQFYQPSECFINLTNFE